MHPFQTKGCVTLCGLAIYIKKYLKAQKKKELWKLKYFTMQKYNLFKKILSLKETKILKNIINSITNVKFQHKPKLYHLSKKKIHIKKIRPIIA